MSTDLHFHIRARALTGFVPLVESLGGDPAALLAAAGVDSRALAEPDSTLPLDALVWLVDAAARELGCPDFGLQLAARQDIGVLGAVALIARSSATVAEAFQGIARYFPYHTPAGRLSLEDDARPDRVQIRYDLAIGAGLPRRQAMELSCAVAYRFLRVVAPGDTSDWEVHFRHAEGLADVDYRQAFDCPVRLGQPYDGLVVPRRLLAIPIDPGRAELKVAAERFVGNLVRRFPLDIGRQVRVLADRQLAAGGCSIDLIARQLGLHKRTLQRRLASQNLHFEALIDDLRRIRAEEYLGHAAIPLGQVAALVGYGDQSSFIRACRRWFGESPTPLRLRLSGQGPAPDG